MRFNSINDSGRQVPTCDILVAQAARLGHGGNIFSILSLSIISRGPLYPWKLGVGEQLRQISVLLSSEGAFQTTQGNTLAGYFAIKKKINAVPQGQGREGVRFRI